MKTLRLLFFLLLTIHLFGASEKDLPKQFELLVKESPGVLTDFSEDVRTVRRGPIRQEAIVDDQGSITIQLSFVGIRDDGRLEQARISSKIHLADLQSSKEAILLNDHLNTLTFTKSIPTCSLAFATLKKTHQAKKILDQLISRAPPKTAKKVFSPATIAREAGFTYLIRTVRCQDSMECTNETDVQNVFWLTKRPLQDIEGILCEGLNRLPIFVYDLDRLDDAPFYTPAIRGSTCFTCLEFGGSLRSTASDDEKDLSLFLKKTPYAGIRFTGDLPPKPPLLIICKKEYKTFLQKAAKTQKLDIAKTAFVTHPGLFSPQGVPLGSTLSWLTGINDNSYEVLGHCLKTGSLTHDLFSGVLYTEFPRLRPLMMEQSCHAKGMTKEQAICQWLQKLSALQLNQDTRTLLEVALLTCELGSPFGDSKDIGYNSWPFALTIAEKIGMSEKQKSLLEFLICKNSPLAPHKESSSSFSAWHLHAKTASNLGISSEELFTAKRAFLSIVASDTDHLAKQEAQYKKVRQAFKTLLPFGIPLGLKVYEGPYPVKRLYSTYLWEARDSKHRDGLKLSKRRAKFEELLLHNARSTAKNSFWDWLHREPLLHPTIYISPSERNKYKAIFENGFLLYPQGLLDATHRVLIFVIDGWGQIYVGIKYDATTPTETNFNHASLLGGLPVASAGKIVFEQNRPIALLDLSGHYRPRTEEIALAVKILAERGVDIQHLSVHLKTMGKKWASGTDFLRYAEEIKRH